MPQFPRAGDFYELWLLMQKSLRNALYIAIGCGWAAAVASGGWQLWTYASTAAPQAQAPVQWPVPSNLSHDAMLPTLVMAVHPKCPCSRASIGELARLMAQCDGKLAATVL